MEGGSSASDRWSALVRTPVPTAITWLVRVGALVLFAGIVFLRGGPVSAQNDAHSVTFPTAAISRGQLRSAEEQTLVPDPPGYPLLMAPVVAVLRPWVGSPVWCTDRPAPGSGPQAALFRALAVPCSGQRSVAHAALPPWYRSQALLSLGAWAILVAGAEMLLGVARRRNTASELVLLVGLAALPAASDAIVESFHPQDLVSVGLACAATAQALRRRWVAVGLLLGMAFLCKQFAVLPFLAVLAAAPNWRARTEIAFAGAGIAAVAIFPFWLVAPGDTFRALSGVYADGAGVIRSATAVGLLGMSESFKLLIARDMPVIVSALLCLGAWWRARDRLLAPAPLTGLALACLATRLAFEVSIYDYYLLAGATLLFVLDLVVGRPPLLSLGWVAATRFALPAIEAAASPGYVAVVFMTAVLFLILVGLREVAAVTEARSPAALPEVEPSTS